MVNVVKSFQEKIVISGLCEFPSEGEACENCKKVIPVGAAIYFTSLDYFLDEGSYICKICYEYIDFED